MVRLTALRTGRLYPPGNIPGTHFCKGLSRPQGHSVAGSNMSMKKSNDTIGNRTRDLQTCSAGPQPTYNGGIGGYFLELKRPEREADNSLPRNASTKNDWSYSSTPPIGLHVAAREKIYFSLLNSTSSLKPTSTNFGVYHATYICHC